MLGCASLHFEEEAAVVVFEAAAVLVVRAKDGDSYLILFSPSFDTTPIP